MLPLGLLIAKTVPEPPAGVAEMARVVRPGGMVASYAWDIEGGGFPNEPLLAEMRRHGTSANPAAELCRLAHGEPAYAVGPRGPRPHRDARDYCATDVYRFRRLLGAALLGASIKATVATMAPEQLEHLKESVRTQLGADHGKPVTLSARANAILGRIPD
jgi:hypothetical protein